MKLKVLKGLRLAPPDSNDFPDEVTERLDKSGLSGAIYIEGDTVEPRDNEGRLLQEMFPGHFEEVQAR